MEFERFLNKYLSGSLSDQELEQFRLLLERSPQYREELRQILDLRSAIQDDALHLTPPESLSDRVRLAVGASFAEAKLGDRLPDAAPEKRRRVVWAPYRLAGVAAVILAVAIPFGPEIFRGGISEAARSVPAAAAASDGVASSASGLRSAGQSRKTDAGAERIASSGSRTRGQVVATGTASGHGELGVETFADNGTGATSSEELPAEMATNRSGDASIAMNNVSLPAELAAGEGIFERSGLVNRDMRSLLQSRETNPTASIALRSSSVSSSNEVIERRNDPMLDVIAMNDPMMVAPGSDDGRTFTVGVTLGSGQISNAKSATALLQNSYYFAVSVSPSDRLGIEMGASAFEQVKNVVSYTSPTAAASSSGTGFWGKRAGVSNPTGRLEFGRGPNSPRGTGIGLTPTLDVMIPIGEFDPTLGNAATQQQNAQSGQVLTQATLVEQRLEQQLTYGAFFYDHRLQISQNWDLCGRLAVGGANESVVGGVRAYAAYNPTKTLTLTLGVGGSTLYNVTTQKVGASSNYGIYYGIETGF